MFNTSAIASELKSSFMEVRYPIMEHFFTIQGEGYQLVLQLILYEQLGVMCNVGGAM